MALTVLEATESDAPRLVAMEKAAYGPSPMQTALFSGPRTGADEYRIADLVKQHKSDPASRWIKVVDPDISTADDSDKIISFATWYVWKTPPTYRFSSFRGPGTNLEACELFFGGMNRLREEHMRGEPYIYLKLLHTDPKHQRRGAGSLLIKWGLEESDRLGLPVVLESSDVGKSLYEKWGFREVERLVADLSPWGGPSKAEVPLMVRPAQLDT